MKKYRYIALALTLSFLTGCATSNYSVGKSFERTTVDLIQKGKTTTSELTSLLGSPYSKAVISTTQQKWIYMHTSGTAKAQNNIFTMKVESTGTTKMLDVLIENDIVINFAYTETVSNYNNQTN